ncbi:tape measure protein [Delftia sp. PS-11]|uniref:tape measure protein n=1 Tax=Delftia sp. PS-11 TaxID=2767222 RepID=UPI0024574419|nr:tape measure protein [Delftia sp. PS-11]KAJ8744603.1 hypothetical protein H9T68_11685 [Delftia sp. PS-11]
MIGSGGSVNYLRFLITGDSSGLETEVEKTKRTVSGMVDSVGSSVGRLGTLLGGVFAGVSVSAFVGKLVSVQREFDVLNSSLVTVSGSAAAAGREMQWLKSFAKETPYGLSQATEAFVKMKALGLDPTQAKLTSFGNTAAAMGKNLMQLIEAVADASTGEFERLKEFGIKASKQGEKVAFTFQGVTTTVKNSAKDITAYLEGIGNTAFGGAMERRANTLDGAIAGLSDSWDEFFRKINESTGFSDTAASGVRKVSDAISGLGNAVEKHQGLVQGMLGALGGAAAVAGIMAVVGAMGVLKGAFVALAALAMANPVTLTLLGIGAVAGAGIAAVNAISNSAEGINKSITGLRAEIERLESDKVLAAANGRDSSFLKNLDLGIAERRKAIEGLQEKLRAIDEKDPRNQMRFKGRGQSYADEATRLAQESAKADRDLIEIRGELLGVDKNYLSQLQKLQDLRSSKKISETEYIDLVSRLAKENYKEDESTKARAASAKQLHTAYVSLADSIDEKIAAQKLEISGGEKLGESDKLRIKYAQDLQGSLKGLGASERASIEAKLKSLKQLEKENEARKVSLRLAEEERKFREEWWAAQARSVDDLESGNKGLREEIELIGLSAVEQAKVLRQREEIILLTKEQQLAEMQRAEDAQDFMSRERINLEQEIALRRERLVLTDMRSARTASAQAAEASLEEWRRGIDQIGQSLSDQLMEGGRSFGDYLRNLGRTLVFKPILQGSMQNVGAYAANMLGVPNGGGSESSGLGAVNSLSSLYSAFGGGLASSIGGVVGKLGSMFGSSAMTSFATGMKGSLLAEGLAGPTTAGATGAMGLGAQFAAALPWVAGGLAVASLLSSDAFNSRGANHAGAAYSTTGIGNDQSAAQLFGRAAGDWYDDLTQRHSADLGKQLGTTVSALSGVYKSLAKYAGDSAKQIDIVAGFAVNPVHGDEDSYGYFKLINQLTGETLRDYTARDGVLGTDPEKAWSKYVADMGSALVSEIKTADIPGWMRSVFDGLDEEITLDGLTAALQEIAALDGLLTNMRRNLQGFGALADSTFTALLKHAGGMEQLGAGVSAYYENFYSEGERAANVARDVTEALASVGIEMPRTRAEFRSLVEANAALGDAGAKTVAVMFGVADAFASVVPEVGKATEEFSQVMQKLAGERRQLEADLLKARGDLVGYAAAMRAIETEGYTDAELAAWDYNKALQQQITDAEAAASATQAAAQALAAMREQANGIVQAQRQSLDALLANLRRQEQQEEGGFVGSLWLSGAEFAQFSAFADQLDGAAGALAQLRTLGLGDELAGYVEQIGAIVRQTEQVLAAELSAQRLRAGDTAGALAAAVSANMPRYADFSAGGQFQAGAFNDAMARQRGQAAAGLLASAQANALSIPNSAAVIAQLKGEVMAYTQESVLRELRVQGAEMFGPMVNGLLTGLWEGMARGAAEGKLLAGNVGSVGWMPGYGTVVGEDLQLVARSIDTINQAFANGRITVQEAEAALEYLNATFGDLIPLLSDTAAQFGRAADAAAAQARAGITSLQGVFGQLSGIVAGMDEAARKANTSLSQATNAIGLLGSMSTEFGKAAAGSVDAAMSAIGMYAEAAALAQQKEEWGQADMYARSAQELRLQLPELRAAEVRGKLVSDAAALAASVLTTADAARAAKELEGKITLGEGQTLRDLTLLVDGLGQYDNTAFYESFARVTDALGKDQITEAQYSTLFDYMVRTYKGVDQEAERAAQALAGLRSAAGSLADQLLLGEFSSFNAAEKAVEATRQYDELIRAAMAGEEIASGDLSQATNAMLGAVRDSTTDPLEMERRFGRTINELRSIERAPEISPEVKQIQALQQEVAKLREALTAAVAGVKDEGQTTNRLLREAASRA